MVVLHEIVVEPEFGEHAPPIGLEEEPALVAMDDWREQDRAFESCRETAHAGDYRKPRPVPEWSLKRPLPFSLLGSTSDPVAKDKSRSTPSWLLPAPIWRFREHLREIRRAAGETQAQLHDTHVALDSKIDRTHAALDSRLAQLDALAADLSRIEALAGDGAKAIASIDDRLGLGRSSPPAQMPRDAARKSGKDLVIGCFHDYDWKVVQYWANSLDMSGFAGDRVALVHNVDRHTQERLRALRFSVANFDPGELARSYGYGFASGEAYMHRFEALFEYLDALPNIDDYRYVIATDVRDLVFQSDPSLWLGSHLGDKWLCANSESIRHRDESWNDECFRRSYPRLYRRVASRTVWNCGILAGDARVVRDFLLQMSLVIAAGLEAADQAAYNLLLSLWPWSELTHFATSEDGWVCQAATTSDPAMIDQFGPHLLEPRPTWDGDRACTSTGEPHAILHQYDRVAEWSEAVVRQYTSPESAGPPAVTSPRDAP